MARKQNQKVSDGQDKNRKKSQNRRQENHKKSESITKNQPQLGDQDDFDSVLPSYGSFLKDMQYEDDWGDEWDDDTPIEKKVAAQKAEKAKALKKKRQEKKKTDTQPKHGGKPQAKSKSPEHEDEHLFADDDDRGLMLDELEPGNRKGKNHNRKTPKTAGKTSPAKKTDRDRDNQHDKTPKAASQDKQPKQAAAQNRGKTGDEKKSNARENIAQTDAAVAAFGAQAVSKGGGVTLRIDASKNVSSGSNRRRKRADKKTTESQAGTGIKSTTGKTSEKQTAKATATSQKNVAKQPPQKAEESERSPKSQKQISREHEVQEHEPHQKRDARLWDSRNRDEGGRGHKKAKKAAKTVVAQTERENAVTKTDRKTGRSVDRTADQTTGRTNAKPTEKQSTRREQAESQATRSQEKLQAQQPDQKKAKRSEQKSDKTEKPVTSKTGRESAAKPQGEKAKTEKSTSGKPFKDKPHDKRQKNAKPQRAEIEQVDLKAEVEGKDEPTGFGNMKLSKIMLESLKAANYREPSPVQAGVIPEVLAGHDVMGQARTGTGKTAAFVIPILEGLDECDPGNEPVALILVPTRELAVQVRDEAEKLAKGRKVRTIACYGGKPIGQQIAKLKQGVDIVVGTPGRVLDLSRRRALTLDSLIWVVLDEADRMLDIGFRPDIEKILRLTPSDRQTLLLSATLPPEVVKLAERYMRNPKVIDFSDKQMAVETIEQFYISIDRDRKLEGLICLIKEQNPKQAIVFCRTKRGADRVKRQLEGTFDSLESLHGDMTQSVRDRVMAKFRAGKVQILVATDVVGRGIDISGISHIINYDIPQFCDDYVHRVGRTGRMGKEGTAFTFVTAEEGQELTRIEMRINQLLKRAELKDFEAVSQIVPQEKEAPKPVFGKSTHRVRRAL